MRQGRRLQQSARVRRAVLKILIDVAMNIVRARLGHDVHDAAGRAPVLRAEAVVDHAEFLHRFLRRGHALHARVHADEVGAVHHDFIAKGAHAAKRNLRRLKVRERRPEAGAAGGYAWCEQGEIGKEAIADREGLDLLRLDDLADLRLGRLDHRGFRGDGDVLLARGHFQPDIRVGRLADGQDDSGLREFGEARGFGGQVVSPGRNTGDDV